MRLIAGLRTAFYDKEHDSDINYRPEFITNDVEQGQKVLTTIEKELSQCDEFIFSVAFITTSGITTLLQSLAELERKGIKGKILTSNYLSFSEPKALRRLAEFKNIEVKLYLSNQINPGFHTKGYIFKKAEHYSMLIGSSNLTQEAITKNKEWNTKLVSHCNGEFPHNLLNEFNKLWKQAKDINEVIDAYEEEYNEKHQNIQTMDDLFLEIKPNSMQEDFLANLEELYSQGAKRALLISATGTGKTYAAAFAAKRFNPKKVLFLVHREQIAKQAMASFEKVIGCKAGLLSGNSKAMDTDYLFSTMQMMAKPEIREQFEEDEFDYIIIDEAHRSGANSYLKIMEYFKPKFYLGLSATPERTDTFDVYAQFDNNIAYEIRLNQALEADLLCPFHYYGIADLTINGKVIDNHSAFDTLVEENRINHVIEKLNYYGYSGKRPCGLIFCKSKEEARSFSAAFNTKGYHTVALFGDDSQIYRESMIAKLITEEDYLDYIFTVDIFNEGVDIPQINQIIMLRQTKSPIVFVQQLGRGLRKAINKEFVVILDFIGNYDNNFMIPVALSGERTYNKDDMRRYVCEANKMINGISTVHFDEIAKKQIYESIDRSKMGSLNFIKESYLNLRYKLNKIPSMIDFINYGEIDLQLVFDHKSLGSYYRLLKRVEPDYKVELNELEAKYIEFISKKIANAKRVHEIILLKLLIDGDTNLYEHWQSILNNRYKIKVNNKTKVNIYNIFTSNFTTGTGKDTYASCIFLNPNQETFVIADEFKQLLNNNDFKLMINEIIEYALDKYKMKYANRYKDTNFVLYDKYTYDDVCRLLEWEKSEVALNIGGYKYDEKTKTYPVFINYDKHEDISNSVKYEDRFLSNQKLIALSKNGRNIYSEDVQRFYNAQANGISVDLFVRKNKEDKDTSKEFYYLGKIAATGDLNQVVMQETNKTAVEITYNLETAVREDIYDYIVEMK